MAETGPGAAPGPPAGPSGQFLTQRMGPLPVWAWMLVTLGAALMYFQWRKNRAAAAASSTTSASSSTAAQTPPFIIQNYTQGGGRRRVGTSGGATSPPPSTSPPPPPAGGGTTSPPPPPVASPPPPPVPVSTQQPYEYRVQAGDTLTKIAARFGTTVAAIWAYNTGTGPGTANRPPATIQELLSRGENNLVTNELFYIPPPYTMQ